MFIILSFFKIMLASNGKMVYAKMRLMPKEAESFGKVRLGNGEEFTDCGVSCKSKNH